MAVQSFVKGDDLKKLIDDKLINAQSVKYVLRQKGILPVCTNSEALSDLIHHHFFGSATMTQMQEVMNFEQNNLKSTVVIISPKSEQSKEDFLTSIADEFVNKGRSSNTKYTLKNIARNQTSVTLQYIYKKPQKGRIKIVIDVNFKQTDLKINIVKTYQLEDDGIERLAPLPSSDQSLYIDYFQNVAYAVYSNLIEKQKDELVKQTIKPEK